MIQPIFSSHSNSSFGLIGQEALEAFQSPFTKIDRAFYQRGCEASQDTSVGFGFLTLSSTPDTTGTKSFRIHSLPPLTHEEFSQ